jgi:hypothetical protein
LRIGKHACGNVDAVDTAGGPDSLLQIIETSAGAAPDIERLVAVLGDRRLACANPSAEKIPGQKAE